MLGISTRATSVKTRVPSKERMVRKWKLSQDNYFEKHWYQGKPRNEDVGGRGHKIGNYYKWEMLQHFAVWMRMIYSKQINVAGEIEGNCKSSSSNPTSQHLHHRWRSPHYLEFISPAQARQTIWVQTWVIREIWQPGGGQWGLLRTYILAVKYKWADGEEEGGMRGTE